MAITHARRMEMEQMIGLLIVTLMLNAGYTVGVDTGGEEFDTVIRSCKDAEGSLLTADIETLYALKNGRPFGCVTLVYGNSGYDTLCDYTNNLETLLVAVHELSDKFEKEAAL